MLPLRHFEQLTGWLSSPWCFAMPPPAPPLLPPIKVPQGYHYLDPDTKVKIVDMVDDQIVFKVSGYQGRYLLYADNAPGYKWVYGTQDYEDQVKQNNIGNPHFDWHEWARYSVDHMWYIKVPTNPGYQTKMLFLEETQL